MVLLQQMSTTDSFHPFLALAIKATPRGSLDRHLCFKPLSTLLLRRDLSISVLPIWILPTNRSITLAKPFQAKLLPLQQNSLGLSLSSPVSSDVQATPNPVSNQPYIQSLINNLHFDIDVGKYEYVSDFQTSPPLGLETPLQRRSLVVITTPEPLKTCFKLIWS
eukprot:TRINITY_DN427_c0_g1_i6.p2 TRINITY_DN427_c0_g1~~TRINITY_DN427_c0_g1_i6.p2  ORF type:complete len:164 (-),score=19.93 TRINITY_DN427_c0_g1_i6:188-679(-)